MNNKLSLSLLFGLALSVNAQPNYDFSKLKHEQLNRGVVAIRNGGKVIVSWRTLRDDKTAEPFDLFRNGKKLNTTPMTKGGTFYIDEHPLNTDATYEVRGGGKNGSFTLKADTPEDYLPVKLKSQKAVLHLMAKLSPTQPTTPL